jgi:hypothetical protein
MASRTVGHKTQSQLGFACDLYYRNFNFYKIFNWNEMNAEHLIAHAKQTSEVTYRDAVPEDRLAFRVGMLEGVIKQLCHIIENHETEILALNRQLIEKDN